MENKMVSQEKTHKKKKKTSLVSEACGLELWIYDEQFSRMVWTSEKLYVISNKKKRKFIYAKFRFVVGTKNDN